MRFWQKRHSGAVLVLCFATTPSLPATTTFPSHHQLCWVIGAYDQTVYCAEIADRQDREESFAVQVEYFGIEHTGVQCYDYLATVYETRRAAMFEHWRSKKLEIVNTTFLSDLDY
jgi:hypothetical protein